MSDHPSPSAAAPKEPAAPPAVRVLVLNSGSSSVKYQLLDMRDRTRLAVGLVERIGEEPPCCATPRERRARPARGPTRSPTTAPR